MSRISQDKINEWHKAKQSTEVMFPTEQCTDECTGKFGFCCTHQEACLDGNNNIVIGGFGGYPLLIITTNWNSYIHICEWKNKQGATMSRGHRDYSFTYGKHHGRHESAHAVEVGHNQGEKLFGFPTTCYVAGYGGQVYRY